MPRENPEDARKVTLYMRVAVHPVKARMWQNRHKITPEMSLRQIGKLVGVASAQMVKHHLNSMVTMGAIDHIGGQYVFPKDGK